MTNFSTKNHDNDSGDGTITVFHRQTFLFDVDFLEFGVTFYRLSSFSKRHPFHKAIKLFNKVYRLLVF